MKQKHSLMSAVLLTTLFAVCTPSFAFYWAVQTTITGSPE